jgi:hypothetical protein
MIEKKYTDLDYALDCAANDINTDSARAELAQLRATIAELEATVEQARELLDSLPYDEVIEAWLTAHPAAVSPENTAKPRSIIDPYAD